MRSCSRSLVAVLLSSLALIACGSPDPHGTGGRGGSKAGSGGEGDGGDGGSGGTGGGGKSGTGGTGGKRDAAPDTAAMPGDASVPGDGPAPGDGPGPVSSECTTAPKSLLCDPLQKMPKTIKETGFFPSAPDFTKRSPRLRNFVPDPPLWSDGMEKERFLLLPTGKKIDNTNAKAWVFPVGTILIKTFFDDGGAAGKTRPIETRFIRRVGTENDFTEYDYYLYQWNAEGTDATLILDDRTGDENAAPTVKITIKHTSHGVPLMINNGMPFDHTLPSRTMCGDCHRENGVAFQTFIGFDELRLNSKVTPTDAKTQLQTFLDAGDVFTTKPTTPPRTIQDADPVLLKVKRFIAGNCLHCHNDKGAVFDMAPEVFVMNTINQPTNAQSVHPPPGWLRVVPGMPEMSVLYVQARRTPLPMPNMAGENRLRPMPPVGVNDIAADQDGITAIRTWIMGLKK